MTVLDRLKEIREEISNIYEDILYKIVLNVDVDDRRVTFLLSELDTLIQVIHLIENKGYKESFILLRSVFEKFFYFWLMLDGKKYRWQFRQIILRTTSATDKEARDMTLAKWRQSKKIGDPHYEDIVDMQAGKEDNVIILNYNLTGLFAEKDGKKTEELIPNYNFMLYEYDPDIRFLTDIPSIIEGEKYPDIRKEEAKDQKMYYHLFFDFDNILRNLKLNGLMNQNQEDMCLVHYSFLSSYVHVGKVSLATWLQINNQSHYSLKNPDEEILKELILLYITKLMHLYLKVLVQHYKKGNPNFPSGKYEAIINELYDRSKDLWFLDNDPNEFDKEDSKNRKSMRDIIGENKQDTVDVLYYENPLTRFMRIRRMNDKPKS